MGLLAVSEPLKFSKSPDTEMVPTKTLGRTVTVSALADAVRKPRLKMVIAKLQSDLFMMMMLLLQHVTAGWSNRHTMREPMRSSGFHSGGANCGAVCG
jgi:hypothetical protein